MPDYFVPQLQRLQAAPSSALKLPNGIGWVRASDGAYVAYVEGYDANLPSLAHAGNQHAEAAILAANTQASVDQALITLQTGDTPTNRAGASLTIAHENLTGTTPVAATVQAIAAPQLRTIIRQDGASDFVQVHNAGVPKVIKGSRYAYCYTTSGTGLLAGFNQSPTANLNNDADGLLAFNGVGYYLLAPEAGDYETIHNLYYQNATGATIDHVNGFDVNGTMLGYARVPQCTNTLYYATSVTAIWTLAAGQFVTPAYYLSAIGGFGATVYQDYFQCRRIA